MNSLEFWKGIALGAFIVLIIILLTVRFAGDANADKAKLIGDRNFAELKRRNDIGRMQCSALVCIGNALMNQQETAVEIRDILKAAHATTSDDEPVCLIDAAAKPPGSIARIYQHDAKAICDMLRNYRDSAIEMENDLTRTRGERDRLMTAMEPFATLFDGPMDNVGGGTLVAPTCEIQWFKDAQSAIGAVVGRCA